ncbi:hypothetical protein JZ751_000254 [Albula glossodonta]|uniref:Vertebrate heat shock transcription factor C-terminal domain-containing protein n=1 Tax=Albula glossodonta TaxID=121402 RepID=A0A8T2PW15_9TELE|nr:hypothetical protein JZ751_000254 [Albula glossodonta]
MDSPSVLNLHLFLISKTCSHKIRNHLRQQKTLQMPQVLLADPINADNSGEDLPILLELEGDSYFNDDTEDATISLLSNQYPANATEDPQLS